MCSCPPAASLPVVQCSNRLTSTMKSSESAAKSLTSSSARLQLAFASVCQPASMQISPSCSSSSSLFRPCFNTARRTQTSRLLITRDPSRHIVCKESGSEEPEQPAIEYPSQQNAEEGRLVHLERSSCSDKRRFRMRYLIRDPVEL
jgi:hypothetical protein